MERARTAGVKSRSEQLVLLMLARRLLYLEPTSSGGVVVCAREDPDALEAMRESAYCGPASALTAALGGGTEEEHAELDQLLEEVDVVEQRVARSQATLEAMRRRCVHLCASARAAICARARMRRLSYRCESRPNLECSLTDSLRRYVKVIFNIFANTTLRMQCTHVQHDMFIAA